MNARKKTQRRKLTARVPTKYKFLLPGLLTTCSLLISFYSITEAISGNYGNASLAIIIAAFFDAFDGRIARLTKTSSTFGENYDSLADVIGFGVTPAILLYCFAEELLNNLGLSVTFIYLACCCVRLARFSTDEDEGVAKFTGMPSPTAGGFVAATVWSLDIYDIDPQVSFYVCFGIALITGLLMVSKLPFISSRRFIIFTRHSISFNTLIMIFYFGLLIVKPAEVLFFSGCLYIAIATVEGIKSRIQKKAPRKKKLNSQELAKK